MEETTAKLEMVVRYKWIIIIAHILTNLGRRGGFRDGEIRQISENDVGLNRETRHEQSSAGKVQRVRILFLHFYNVANSYYLDHLCVVNSICGCVNSWHDNQHPRDSSISCKITQ